MILIGIDPGVETGIAAWDAKERKLHKVECMTILEAMECISKTQLVLAGQPDALLVIFEDARRRKWFGDRADRKTEKYGAGVREGVGSVKRDCSIWEEFLTSRGLPFEARYPSNTKMRADNFERLTGWKGRTNEHARDAALIVFGMNESIARAKLIAFQHAKDAGRAGQVHSGSGTRAAV